MFYCLSPDWKLVNCLWFRNHRAHNRQLQAWHQLSLYFGIVLDSYSQNDGRQSKWVWRGAELVENLDHY